MADSKRPRRGRPPGMGPRRRAIAEFIAEHIRCDPKRRGATGRAMEAASHRFGKRRKPYDRRELEKIWAQYRYGAALDRYIETVRADTESVRAGLPGKKSPN